MSKHRDFIVFSSSKNSSTAKLKLQLKSLDSSRQRSQFKEGQEGLDELLGGNSRTISDCWVSGVFLKHFPAAGYVDNILKFILLSATLGIQTKKTP